MAPYLRDGGAGRGTGREPPGARRDDVAAIRISNLSNFTVEADLDDLVKGFGPVQKLYLAKEKVYFSVCLVIIMYDFGSLFIFILFFFYINSVKYKSVSIENLF